MAKRFELSAIFKGIDRVTRPVSRMTSNIQKSTRQMSRAFTRVNKKIKSVGNIATRSLGRAVLGVTALTTAAASYLAIDFAKGAVADAAAWESLGVRLEVLTGSADGAKKVMEDLDAIVTKTPFDIDELGRAAASMAVVFSKDTAKVSEFTGVAADLASAFGRPIEQIGENLSRAFSAGLGSADVLREAGISAEILRLSGRSKVAEVTTEDLTKALRKMTQEGGKAFGAAAKQAETLEGAISNSGVAFKNVRRLFGLAIAPAVQDTLLNVVIPAFEQWGEVIKQNEKAITSFAKTELPRMAKGFINVARDVIGWFIEVKPKVFGFIDSIGGMKTILIVLGGLFAAMIIAPLAAIVIAIGPVGIAVGILAGAFSALGVAIFTNWDRLKAFVKSPEFLKASALLSISPVAFAAGLAINRAGFFEESPTADNAPSGVMGPTGRQQQSFIERLTQNNGTLVVRAEPGTSVESDQQRVGPFRLDLQQSGAN